MRALPMLGAAALLAVSAMSAEAAGPWTGCGVGIMGGVSATNVEVGFTGLGSVDGLSADGWQGGAGIGCDVQFDRIVVGMFADWQWIDADFEVSTPGPSFAAGLKDAWTVGGRAGFVVGDRTLIYGLVGYTQASSDSSLSGAPAPDFSGYVLGAGMEAFVASNVTLKGEYRASLYDGEDLGIKGLNIEPTTHAFLVGLSYRFGGIKPLDDLAK